MRLARRAKRAQASRRLCSYSFACGLPQIVFSSPEIRQALMGSQAALDRIRKAAAAIRWVGDSRWSMNKNRAVTETVVLARDGFDANWALAKPLTQE